MDAAKRNVKIICRNSSETMKNLPQELIIEILLRLPVKSLLRFRSVSKLWLSLISDPQFAISHFELSSKHTNRLINIAGSEVRSLDFEASFQNDSSIVKLSFPPTSRSDIDIVGSCRGFLLLVDSLQLSSMFFWNPSTGFCKRLYFPLSPELGPFTYGFGYDDSTDDYLVVLVYCYESSIDDDDDDWVTHFEIFSPKSNSWEEIKGAHFSYEDAELNPEGGTILNGTIHWLVSDHDARPHVILAFDLTERVFRELPILDDEFEYKLQFSAFGVHGRCLSLSFVDEDATEIWIMKEYGVKSSWTKSIIVSVEHVPKKYFSPICFTKGGDIVGTYGCSTYGPITGLMKFNCQGELLEHHSYNHQPCRWDVAVYTESLLSLPSSYNEEGGKDN